MRQWVLSFPIRLRIRFVARSHLLTAVLQIIRKRHCDLSDQAGVTCSEAHTGAVTLIQRFGSAANLDIHLHCLVLDGV